MTAALLPADVPAATNPCRDCPWRVSNRGRPSPGGWYTLANVRRLWRGLRTGERMSCHPTDARMGDPEMREQAYDGFRPAPDGAEMKECTGALIVVQREYMTWQNGYGGDLKAYRRDRPKGLTRAGLIALVERAMFGRLATPDLTDDDIAHPDLPWSRPDTPAAANGPGQPSPDAAPSTCATQQRVDTPA